MKLLWKNDIWNYRITIKGKDNDGNIVIKVYETIGMITNMWSKLRGRATRVYEAYDPESPGIMVVIKCSWVDANCPKEGDVLGGILDSASEEEKALFLTVLIHGIVTIDGREDLTEHLLDGYLVTTGYHPVENKSQETEQYNSYDSVLHRIMGELNAIKTSAEDTVQSDRIHKASIFELLKVSKFDSQAESQSASLFISPDMSALSFDYLIKRQPLVYGPKVHYRIVFKERGESLHRMSHQHEIELLPVIQAMYDILKGGWYHFCSMLKISNLNFILSFGLFDEERIRAPR